MSLSVANVGGSLTGGATVVLAPAGQSGTKATFTTPDHTRLTPQTVDLYVTQATTTPNDPGVAKAALKVTFSDKQESEGCCTIQAGSVILDVNMRWHLNQPSSLVDDAWEVLQALLFNASIKDLLVKGVYPV